MSPYNNDNISVTTNYRATFNQLVHFYTTIPRSYTSIEITNNYDEYEITTTLNSNLGLVNDIKEANGYIQMHPFSKLKFSYQQKQYEIKSNDNEIFNLLFSDLVLFSEITEFIKDSFSGSSMGEYNISDKGYEMLQSYIDKGGSAAVAFLYTNCPDDIIGNAEIFICTHELEL